MTKILYDNHPKDLDPFTDWDISLYSDSQEELALFQLCKITENTNKVYLERGRLLIPSNIGKLNLKDTYTIQIKVDDSIWKVTEVKLKDISDMVFPGRRIIISFITATYQELIK